MVVVLFLNSDRVWLTNCDPNPRWPSHSWWPGARRQQAISFTRADLFFTCFKHCLKWHQWYDHVFGLSKTHLCVCLFHVCWCNYWASYKYKSCKARYLANIDPHANSRTVNPMPPRSWYTYNCNQTGCRRVFLIQIGAWGQVDQILCW